MTDYTVGDTLHLMFTTRQFSTGAPTTLAGTPAVAAYENESLTQITAGITLGVDHDSVTGLNLLTIVASGANGYESGKDYHLVITTGTVDSVSVVGEVVGRFTIGRSAAAVDLANGTDGLGAIKAETAAILDDTDLIDDGTSGLAKIATDVAAVLVDTAEIGAAGAGLTEAGGTGDHLTAVPWNAAWDAEVQSEVQDAIEANNLDHLVGTATGIPAVPAGTFLDQIMDDGTAVFDRTTDSLQAIRDTAPLGTAMRGTDNAALASVCTEARLAELDAANIPADVDAILVDTGTTLQAELDGIQADTEDIQTKIGTPTGADIATDIAAVQTEVDKLDAAQTEPTGVPAANASPLTKIGHLYMQSRNKITITASKKTVFGDDDAAEWEKDLSDDGTTYTESEANVI